jgi:hypothetical protein
MADLKDIDTQPLDPSFIYLPEAQAKYQKAIEVSLCDLPVINGVIDLDSIWLECALPKDLIIEIFKLCDVQLPDNVDKVMGAKGQVLAEKKPSRTGEPSL